MRRTTGLPSPARLGITLPTARADLDYLGFTTEEFREVLLDLGNAPLEDVALSALVRLYQAVEDHSGTTAELTSAILTDVSFRARLFGLLGSSTALGDHVVARPHLWKKLLQPAPSREELFTTMLGSVDAQPERVITDAAEAAAAADSVRELGPTASAGGGGTAASLAAMGLAAPPPPRPARTPRPAASPPAAETPAAESAEPSRPAQPEWGIPAETPKDLSGPGTYRAGITGGQATAALRSAYLDLICRIAADDLAQSVSGEEGLSFSTVSQLLADAADAALTAALAVAVATVYPHSPCSTHLAVIAMGKCGARELNYISDVDVIFVAEPADNKASRLAGEMIRIGCNAFFEVDAALRPEGKAGALVRTLASHLSYYRRWASTWEFQALLKARPMTGQLALGQVYLDQVNPMVWTACERDSFVDDVRAMRLRVIDHVPEEMRPRELKLGPGGLRDVEFAVQLLQMVHGRIDNSLHVTSTLDALGALVSGGYVGRKDGHVLSTAYQFMRLLEHRLQLQRFKRTHALPAAEDEPALRWLARAAGFRTDAHDDAIEALLKEVRTTSSTIRKLHRRLFYRPLLNSVAAIDADTQRLSRDAAIRQLAALGYVTPERAFEHLSSLASGVSRAARIQALILPSLLEWVAETPDPDAGLLAYRRLSEVARDEKWFLRLLRDDGVVGQRLMRVLGSSAYLVDLLLSSVSVVKLYADGSQGPKLLLADSEAISHSLVVAAERHSDPKKAVEVARALRRSELARIASADLLGFMDVADVCRALSFIWDAVLEAALGAEIRAWQAEHPEDAVPAEIAVIGMGRLGGAELGYGSDADVLFVCQPTPGADEHEAVKWATQICDRARAALSQPSNDPPLEVDTDLRPEGRSGALVRTLDSYRTYYQQWAETWEVQALLRAYPIAGSPSLGQQFLELIDPIRYVEGGIDAKTVQQIRRMKARVDNERLPHGANRMHHTKLGRGGLTDVEWTVQLLQLQQADCHPQLKTPSTLKALAAAVEAEVLSAEDAAELELAWLTATRARNALVLVRGRRTDELPTSGPHLVATAFAAGHRGEPPAFLDNYLRVTRRASRVIDRVFWDEHD